MDCKYIFEDTCSKSPLLRHCYAITRNRRIMQAVPIPSQILYTYSNFLIIVEKIFTLGGPHSTVASYFGVQRRNDEAEETASSPGVNIFSTGIRRICREEHKKERIFIADYPLNFYYIELFTYTSSILQISA